MVSKTPLRLTWWPLFRDCMFYLISLTILIITFTDYRVELHESLILITVYGLYVLFMTYNRPIEAFVKRLLSSSIHSPGRKISPLNSESSRSVQAVVNCMNDPDRIREGKTTFSLGMIQLIMHSLDPLNQETNAKEMAKLYAASSFSANNKNCDASTSEGKLRGEKKVTAVVCVEQGVEVVSDKPGVNHTTLALSNHEAPETSDNSEVTEDEQFDMSWPDTARKRFLYLFILPITLPLFLTLPDVRRQDRERFFLVTFAMSILWIGLFTYLMVWLAHQVVETTGLSETVMGLTFLAAGTSVPDLITSVIVARKGKGDMAVSSSVGSNIFDVTIGLPFPWALATIIKYGSSVGVESHGLFCSVLLLAIMLLLVVICIACNGWLMTKRLGLVLFVLYIFFLVFSLLLELRFISCPVSLE